jgi:HTH-type transcriptional regulator / antitoxin HipB
MHVRTPRDLGLVIAERRRQLGLDQAELARRAGVSRQWIIAIEKGKPRAEIGLVLRTLRELGVDVWLGALPSAETEPTPRIDLDRVIEKARGKR